MQYLTFILAVIAAFFACMLGKGAVGGDTGGTLVAIFFILTLISAIVTGSKAA
ncbi:MAG: hypothetical protein ACE14T_00370 [Syntrophales bacterium]